MMLRTVQIIFVALGLLMTLGGDRLAMPVLFHGGIICFGLFAISLGWEAILTREIQMGSRRRGTRQTYTGLPAVLQGVQFNLLGLFLIGLSFAVYYDQHNQGRAVVLQIARRPGLALVGGGLLLALQAVKVLIGYRELYQGPGWVKMLNMVVARFMPGVILLALGLAALALGLFEFVSPQVFDAMGGGFLEELYRVRE